MAKKKIKEVDLELTESTEVQEVSIEIQEEVQPFEEQVEEQIQEPIEEVLEVTELIADVPVIEESPTFKDNDIVLFENKQGELRYAPYKYIAKRGYKAIELYKAKK
jgi:hypothetical protein